MTRRIRTAVGMGLREFRRTPVLLALLAVLPAYFVGIFVLLVPETTIRLGLDGPTVTASMSAFAAAFMTAVAVAILSGVVGLFLVVLSEGTDDRLRLAGYSSLEIVLSRLATLCAGVAVVTAVAVAVALQVFQPANAVAFAATAAAVGVTYGVVGVVVGLVVDRLSGVYVMLFVPMVDVLLFQNPLATDAPAWASYLPGHAATTALFQAAFASGVDGSVALRTAGYAGGLLALSVLVFSQRTRSKT